MARYIDADKFVEWQDNRQDTDLYMGWDYVKQCLYDDYVKADVAPVIHAHWIEMYNGDWLCSKCDNILPIITDIRDERYCSWCGAKMDEEVE
jgi:hypothetical protein